MLLAVMAAGCGDNASPYVAAPLCASHEVLEAGMVCKAAVMLATRYGDTLFANQGSVDRIYEALKKAYQVEPVLGAVVANPGFAGYPLLATVKSTYAPIVANWSIGEVGTGDDRVDSIFQANGAYEVAVSGGDGARYGYNVSFDDVVNMRILAGVVAERIPETMVVVNDPIDVGYDSWLEFRPDGMTATIAIGWTDCIDLCKGTHWYEVEIPDIGRATVVREWGDPIPAEQLAYFLSYPPPK
jgi:hypothetical protein